MIPVWQFPHHAINTTVTNDVAVGKKVLSKMLMCQGNRKTTR